jgi:uncharacterized phage protein gp47/JayE
MPIQTPKSSTQYAYEILTVLQSTGILNISPGGKARALADIIADRMGDLETRQFITVSQNLLPYATDVSLDALGAIFGMTRLPASDASSPATDGNFEFYVTSGTFGDINSGNQIIIPAGTMIFTSAIGGAIYTVDVENTLPASSSSVFVGASSTTTGSTGNAPAGVFNQTNFVNYTQSDFGTLLVTNNFGIIGGSDAETDDDFRYRIQLRLQSTGGNGEVDIRTAILQIPGIQDIVFNPLAGTYEVYVYGISPQVPQSLLTLVQIVLNENTAYPLTGLAIVPDLVGISLATTLTLQAGLSSVAQTSVISSAQTAVANYINNLAVGQEFVINEAAVVIMNSDTRILDIGSPNQPLSSIFIWRSRSDGTRYSQYLVNDYTPAIGERVIVEESIANPINLTIAS